MDTTNNCQNCDSKNKVIIAGKTYCANCGAIGIASNTPMSTSAQQSTNTPNQTKDNPSTSNTNNDLVDSLTKSLSGNVGVLNTNTVNTSTLSEAISNTKSDLKPTPVINNSNTKQSSTPTALNIQPSQAIDQKTTQTQNITTPLVSNATTIGGMRNIKPDSIGPGKNNQVINLQDRAPKLVTANPPLNKPNNTTSDRPETLGSELGSLDVNDEHVFSDDQFNSLAQIGNNRPVDVAQLSQKPSSQVLPNVTPMNDIRPTNSAQSRQIVTPNSTSINTKPAQSKLSSMPANSSDFQINDNTQSVIAQSTTHTSAALIPVPTKPDMSANSPNVSTMIAPNFSPDQNPLLDNNQGSKPKRSITKKNTKVGTVALTALGLILLGVYVWQVNYPNLALKVDINSSPGSISYRLSSRDGKSSATVNEKKSDWDSQALAENYVNNQSDKYLALQAQGLTIYVYNNQASWVNNGTWYRIEGSNTGLSQDQLIRMATSL
jgi:hypothetical protein